MRYILSLFVGFLISSCIQNYDLENLEPFKKKIVINSLLCPDSTIKADIFWSKKFGDTTEIEYVCVGQIKLFENDILIINDTLLDGKLRTTLYPKSGSRYRINFSLATYQDVYAETSIPEKSILELKHLRDRTKSAIYSFFVVKSIITPIPVRALWLASRQYYEDGSNKQVWEYYSDNPFLDPINSAIESKDVEERGSNVLYEKFIRISMTNILESLPLQFSLWRSGDKYEYPPWDNDSDGPYPEPNIIRQTNIIISVISPSDEFDKYFRSLYKQFAFNFSSDTPLFWETIAVYTNVTNGLGIFAGYNASQMVHEISEE